MNDSENKTGIAKENEAEALKAKYGKVYRIGMTLSPDDETEIEISYIFKKPSVASYDRYIKTASKGTTKALKTFLFDSVTDESRDQLSKDLEEYPALPLAIGERLLEMMGLAKDVNLKLL